VIKEFVIGGVYIHGALVCAAMAGLCLLFLRKIFGYVGGYSMFVNHGLFDLCAFIILWGLWTVVIAK